MLYKNVLLPELHTILVKTITQLDFPWYFQPNIAYTHDPLSVDNPNRMPSFGLTHTVWDIEKGKVSELLQLMGPLLDSFKALSGVKINNFIRIKINLQTPIPGNSPDKYNGAHVDRYTPHKTLIYYPTTSDGDTFIFNESYDRENPATYPNVILPTVKERITPVANSLYYLEDGFRYHSSSNPILSDTRYSINFNFD
jgi:hypothetical protein